MQIMNDIFKIHTKCNLVVSSWAGGDMTGTVRGWKYILCPLFVIKRHPVEDAVRGREVCIISRGKTGGCQSDL